MMDEDNDGRSPDDSLVETLYPRTRQEELGDRSAWPWLRGAILSQCRAGDDRVLVNKLVYHFRSIQPGDIIVFNGNGSWNPNPPAKPPSGIVVRAYDATLGWLFHQIGGCSGLRPSRSTSSSA